MLLAVKSGRVIFAFIQISLVLLLINVKCRVIAQVNNSSLRLVFASVIYRHGDRSPTHLLPNNVHGLRDWPQGLRKLTQKGMRQEAQLGRYLKNRYVHQFQLINATYFREEVRIRSTDFDHALMSAEAQLSALYRPIGKQIWNKNLLWQPIPIHTVPRSEDTLLRGRDILCPIYARNLAEYRNSEEFKNFLKKHQSFAEEVCKLAEYTGNQTFIAVHQINDALLAMKNHNITLPLWANSTILAKLQKITFFLKSARYHGEISHKTAAGELIYYLVKDMEAAKLGIKSNPSKLMMYSAHGSSILGLLLGMGVHVTMNPPYSSAVMIELYKDRNGSFLVQMLYRNSSVPVVLQLRKCKRFCPLDKFIKYTSNFVVAPRDRKKFCMIKDPNNSLSVNIAFPAVIGIVIFLIGVFLISRYFRKQRKPQLYSIIQHTD